MRLRPRVKEGLVRRLERLSQFLLASDAVSPSKYRWQDTASQTSARGRAQGWPVTLVWENARSITFFELLHLRCVALVVRMRRQSCRIL